MFKQKLLTHMNLNTHYLPSLIISPNKDPGMPFILYLLTTDLGFKSIISLSYYTFLLFLNLIGGMGGCML